MTRQPSFDFAFDGGEAAAGTTAFDRDALRRKVEAQRTQLSAKIAERRREMETDDDSHLVVYELLGIGRDEGREIDILQNVGRLFYANAGALIEGAVADCIASAHPAAAKTMVPSLDQDGAARNYEIDCLVGVDAYEIKWRDATTDGDHAGKEERRLKAIAKAGFRPVRLMFFEPNRASGRKAQARIAKAYRELGGAYHCGADAWRALEALTGIDLLAELKSIIEGDLSAQAA